LWMCIPRSRYSVVRKTQAGAAAGVPRGKKSGVTNSRWRTHVPTRGSTVSLTLRKGAATCFQAAPFPCNFGETQYLFRGTSVSVCHKWTQMCVTNSSEFIRRRYSSRPQPSLFFAGPPRPLAVIAYQLLSRSSFQMTGSPPPGWLMRRPRGVNCSSDVLLLIHASTEFAKATAAPPSSSTTPPEPPRLAGFPTVSQLTMSLLCMCCQPPECQQPGNM
jgi:hypothetical protein